MHGDEIRDLREAAGLTQQELGAKVGVSLRTIGNWERGETVPRNKLGRLRRVLAGETVSPVVDAFSQVSEERFRHRRPEGIGEKEWAAMLAKTEGYLDALIEDAAKER
jgi:transcriptional regulator with XRE-family HTH domain